MQSINFLLKTVHEKIFMQKRISLEISVCLNEGTANPELVDQWCLYLTVVFDILHCLHLSESVLRVFCTCVYKFHLTYAVVLCLNTLSLTSPS